LAFAAGAAGAAGGADAAGAFSWVAVGLGVGTFTLSYLVGDGSGSKRKHAKKPVARIYGGIGPASVVVGGEL
jgi:hypothetical protein